MVNYRERVRALKTSVAVGRKRHVTVTAAGLDYYAYPPPPARDLDLGRRRRLTTHRGDGR